MSMQDDEILGKAYDARLMRRLLVYLRPYWRQVLVALAAIIAGAAGQLAQPYLVKVAIDQHIAVGRLDGLDTLAAVFLAVVIGGFAAEYLPNLALAMKGPPVLVDPPVAVFCQLPGGGLQYYDKQPVGPPHAPLT